MSTVWGCKKDSNSTQNQTQLNNSSQLRATLVIARSYLGATPMTDSILPSSYWSRNGNIKYLPLLALSYSASTTQIYPDYNDTIYGVSIGDDIELHLDLKHPTADSTMIQGGGVFVILSQVPNGSINGQFMCYQGGVSSQSIHYTIH